MTLGGNEMESGMMEVYPPIGEDTKCGKVWERVLVVANGY
jgi:hypothetical protein